MLLEGHRAFAYAAPTTYKRITPKNGCGFILKRIYDLTENPDMPRGMYCKNPTKQDVYLGTKWSNRPGFASVLWTALLEDGLIESEDGMAEYSGCSSPFSRKSRHYSRANGHYEFGRGWTVRYRLTDKGRHIYEEMMARVNKVLEDKKEFCKRNGIEFGTGKPLSKDEIAAICKNAGLIPIEEAVPDGKAALDKLEHFDPDLTERLDNVIRELQEIRDSLS